MILTLGPSELETQFSFTIDDANKKYHRNYDSIGVYLSGGLDSVALLILILSELKATDMLCKMPVFCYTVRKNDFSTAISPGIVQLVEKKFNIIITHFNEISNNSDNHISMKIIINNFIQNKQRLFFLGINHMPDKNLKSFNNKLSINYSFVKDKVFCYSPFLFLHKPQILDIFYKLNCEDILPYTYSCTIQPHIPCNNCYACEERAWGFQMLKKQDPLFAQN